MNLAQLIWKMWQLRVKNPRMFTQRYILCDGQQFTIACRSAIVKTTICAESEIFEKMLQVVYADQNPLGKSAEAELVRTGMYQPHQIGWLYIENYNQRRLWLGKIVDGRPIPFKVGEYNSSTKSLNLSL